MKQPHLPNSNILSLPEAQTRHLSGFVTEKRQYNIVLIIGGNAIFTGSLPLNEEPDETAKELTLLADELVPLATEKIFGIGIRTRGKDSASKRKAKATNKFINKLLQKK